MNVAPPLPLIAWNVSHDSKVFWTRDTTSYVTAAQEMVAYGTFTSGGQPELERTPGFPVLLVPGVWLGQLELVTIALNIMLSAATVWLVYRLSLQLFGRPQMAAVAAALYAIEPLSILYCSFLLTETLFAFLTALMLLCMELYIQLNTLRHLIGSA